jgi:DNA invertase Pin-like site-specific DNA recombinase
MDIAIYSRISTDKQDNRNQLGQLRAFAHTQGWSHTEYLAPSPSPNALAAKIAVST